jgi:hypothetical protein
MRWFFAAGAGLLVAAALLVCASCSKPPVRPEVAMCTDSSGSDMEVYMIFDTSGSNLLGEKPKEVITLTKPSEELKSPWTYFTRAGELGVVLDQKDSSVTESTTYGSYHWEVLQPGGERLTAFVRQGDGEKGFGTLNGKVYRFAGGKSEVIGEDAYQSVVPPGGDPRTERMTRLKGPNQKWTTDLGGRIVERGPGGRLAQVGWVSWRKITLPHGTHLALLMTKTMDPGAKWAGRYGGRLYQDK